MKKIAFLALAIVCFFTTFASVGGAQTVSLRVNIPFHFNVDKKVLPAGQYLILAQNATILMIGPNDVAAVAITNRIDGKHLNGTGEVVFNCYGSRCFLSRLWTVRSDTGQELLKGAIEKELAGGKEQPTLIALKGMPSNH